LLIEVSREDMLAFSMNVKYRLSDEQDARN